MEKERVLGSEGSILADFSMIAQNGQDHLYSPLKLFLGVFTSKKQFINVSRPFGRLFEKFDFWTSGPVEATRVSPLSQPSFGNCLVEISI